MHLMERAVIKVSEDETVRERQVLDLSYDPELSAFYYVYRGTLTCTLREHVRGYRERNTSDDT